MKVSNRRISAPPDLVDAVHRCRRSLLKQASPHLRSEIGPKQALQSRRWALEWSTTGTHHKKGWAGIVSESSACEILRGLCLEWIYTLWPRHASDPFWYAHSPCESGEISHAVNVCRKSELLVHVRSSCGDGMVRLAWFCFLMGSAR